MFKQMAVDLSQLRDSEVQEWLQTFDTVLTDCDGVLWTYGNVIDGSVEAINGFKAMGKKVFLCTNNSTRTRSELLQKCQQMGFNIELDEILSTAHLAASYLKERNFDQTVYIIGTKGIAKELDAVNIPHTSIGPDHISSTLSDYMNTKFKLEPNIGAVVVGFDEYFSYPKIMKAATYLSNTDCLFIATNTDERFPMPSMVIPGTGCLVRCIEICTERKAIVMGKPNPDICAHFISNGTIVPERTLMIGDRCNTDVLLGYNCGFQTLLVGSGMHNLNHVAAWRQTNNPELLKLIPDAFLPKLGDITQFMPL